MRPLCPSALLASQTPLKPRPSATTLPSGPPCPPPPVSLPGPCSMALPHGPEAQRPRRVTRHRGTSAGSSAAGVTQLSRTGRRGVLGTGGCANHRVPSLLRQGALWPQRGPRSALASSKLMSRGSRSQSSSHTGLCSACPGYPSPPSALALRTTSPAPRKPNARKC